MEAVLNADATSPLANIRLPLLYLQATEDRLVPAAAGTRLATCRPHTVLLKITGPHMLLETAPDACVRAIAEFRDGLAS